MSQKFYVAACVFTEEYPALSKKICDYLREKFSMPIIRCCVDKYKVAEFEARMPENFRDEWRAIKHFEKFPYPNHHGEAITIQDCWRSKENSAEQEAARELLRRMNFKIVELEENHERTKFCGVSLYQPQPPRNPKLAPKRFLHGAQGLFQEHTPEQKNCSCWSTAQRFGQKKLLHIAIIAFAG